jgi:hypothetical protein
MCIGLDLYVNWSTQLHAIQSNVEKLHGRHARLPNTAATSDEVEALKVRPS